MNRLSKILVLMFVLALGFTYAPPAAAQASCDYCTCASSCSQICRIEGTSIRTTCGQWGDCQGLCGGAAANANEPGFLASLDGACDATESLDLSSKPAPAADAAPAASVATR